MLQPRFRTTDFRVLVLIGVGMYATYLAAAYIANGNENRLYLLGAFLLGGLVLYRPRLGLYAFCFTLILVPTGLRIEGLKSTSPSAMMIGLSIVALAVSILTRRSQFKITSLYAPIGVAIFVAGLNLFLRYGSSFWNIPLILSESMLVFALSYHLIREPGHVRRLLIVILVAVALRTIIDVVMTVMSLQVGTGVGAIRSENAWLQNSSTAESQFRGMLLPVFIAVIVLSREKALSALALVAMVASLAWLSLAYTRQGFIGIAMAPAVTFLFLSAVERRRVLRLVLLGLPVVILFATYFSGAWEAVLIENSIDLERGFDEGGRPAQWAEAFRAFLENPLIGSSYGGSHSFWLGSARSMGLVFLVPYFFLLWLVWRHGAWLRKQPLDPMSRVLVVGMQGGLLMALVFNSIGQMFQGASSAFYFWMLVGVQEAIYYGVRTGQFTIVGAKEIQDQEIETDLDSDDWPTPFKERRTLL